MKLAFYIPYIYLYNKQITPQKVLCTDFIHSLQNFKLELLQLVNKNLYGALSMK